LLIAGAMPAQMLVGTPVHDVNAKWLTDDGSQVCNVKAYGAKGDGVTDDTAALIAATPTAGKVYVPPGNYKITGTWIIPRSVSVECSSDNASIINYVGTSAAVAIGDAAGSTLYPRGAMHNCRIRGPGTRGSTVGLLVGGDPAGVITPNTYYADEYSFYNVTITEFHWGLELGKSTWLNSFFNCGFIANAIGIYYPSAGTNGVENDSFHGGVVANSVTNAMQIDGMAQLRFFGTSFDYNISPIIGYMLWLEFYGCHFEAPNGPFIDNTGNPGSVHIIITGGEAVFEKTSGNDVAYFNIDSCGPGCDAQLSISGTRFQSEGRTVTQIVNYIATNMSGGGSLRIENLPPYYGPGLSYSTPLTNSLPAGLSRVTLLGNWGQASNVFLPKPPGARVYNSTAESIPNASEWRLSFDTARWNNGGVYNGSNKAILTAPIAGVYQITANVVWDANATGERDLRFVPNASGSPIIALIQSPAAASGARTVQTLSTLWHLNAGDYVSLQVWQTSGGTLNVLSTAGYSPEFAMQWVGP
jgi:hypothetical protein